MRSVQTTVARVLAILALALPLALTAVAGEGGRRFITIGTGAFNSLYFKAGRRICNLVNKTRAQTGLLCSTENTGGSIDNLSAIRAGRREFGLAQSDWHHHAYRGSGRFARSSAFDGLRSLFSLHPEAFTVVVRSDAGIRHIDDLEGKRVNIGNPGSGHRATMEALMKALEWDIDHFSRASELEADAQIEALCNNTVDAVIFTEGHPNTFVHDATTRCRAVLIPVEGAAVDALLANSPVYRPVSIPGGIYRNHPADIRTFGVDATVVVSSAVDDETVYRLVGTVFEHLDDLKSAHPALFDLSRRRMIENGLSAPLHAGALRYYKESGLMQ